ncbi:AbrB family transcriptional regulator [Falsiroseomonas sp. HW251]|uniref:AbrB family transcriptional regulator n=1 Tax=Falsiroseomonas sp. HW251 TaxID=3390998 RepID=UPI003D3200CC
MPLHPALSRALPPLVTAAAAAGGGAALSLLHVPLPWMLGAMAATAALAWHERAAVSAPVRPVALVLLGLGLGQTFTPSVMKAVALTLPWLLLAAMASIATGLLLTRFFSRLAHTDSRTGFYATVPGGVLVMAVLAQRAGLPAQVVTLAQTVRIMLVVVIVPPLVTLFVPHGNVAEFLAERPEFDPPGLVVLLAAGFAVALVVRRLGLANPWMLGPCAMVMALSAQGLLPSGVPMWMVNAAQIGMGMSLGQRVSKRFLLSSRRLALASLVTTLLLILITALAGGLLAWASGLPLAASLLGLAPGGMPEMTITAKTLEVGVPLVLGFHLVRTLLINVFVEPIWKLAAKLGV